MNYIVIVAGMIFLACMVRFKGMPVIILLSVGMIALPVLLIRGSRWKN